MVRARGLITTKEGFIAFWEDNVMRLALLLHQARTGVAVARRMKQVGARPGAGGAPPMLAGAAAALMK
jgi:hypothetical protein